MREPIYERTDFASADHKYRALVAHFRSCSWVQPHLSTYVETGELSAIEAEIFGIDPALMSDLFWAYERYLNLIGAVDAYFWDVRDQDRRDHPNYFRGECVSDMGIAVRFMSEVCGLPDTQCFGWVLKITAAELRGGLLDSDEDEQA